MNEHIAIEQSTKPSAASKWIAEKKSHITNLVAIILIAIGYYLPDNYGNIISTAGSFAFSGAITNWLAIHMLFEKVPFLYGSGIIPLQFQEFKHGIKQLILQQFFTTHNINRFLDNSCSTKEITAKLDQINFDVIFDDLSNTIMRSSFGGMLEMLGGKQALTPLKQPVIETLKSTLSNIAHNELSTILNDNLAANMQQKIEKIVVDRLNELTPQMVKKIIQDIIQKHLGWLVVWGGVFGGVIGVFLACIR